MSKEIRGKTSPAPLRLAQDVLGIGLFSTLLLCAAVPAIQPLCFKLFGLALASLPLLLGALAHFGAMKLKKFQKLASRSSRTRMLKQQVAVAERDLAAIYAIIGVSLLCSAWFFFSYLQKQPEGWIEVKAVVKSSKVVQERSSYGSSRSVSFVYRPEIRFDYEYEGKNYSSLSNAGYSLPTGIMTAAQRIADSYEEGKAVSAWVFPERPLEAQLRATEESRFSPRNILLFAAFSLFLLVFGLITCRLQEKFKRLVEAALIPA